MIKKLIAIDLSTTSTGVAIFMNGEYYKSRTIIPDKKLCVINRIYHIYRELKKVIDYPDMVVVEKALSLQNGDTTIKLAKLHGVLLSICMEQMVKLEEIDNKTVKSMILKGNSTKEQIKDYLEKFYKIKTQNTDESDAVSVGLVWIKINNAKEKGLIPEKRKKKK
jgi:Holliday junction resolvasome RuvABC endonuclease subunit